MARNVYGLDLGSYDIKVYDKKKDTIWKEKNVIAFKDNRDRDIFAVGDDAFSMYGKAPSNIEITFPMEAGVISRFNDMQFLLQNLLKRGRQFSRGSEYVIAVPTDVTEVDHLVCILYIGYICCHSGYKSRRAEFINIRK